MVQAKGGTIACESKLGEGSLFTNILAMPAAKRPQRGTDPAGTAPAGC